MDSWSKIYEQSLFIMLLFDDYLALFMDAWIFDHNRIFVASMKKKIVKRVEPKR